MGTKRVWLVDRTYNDKGMFELVYATPDGEQYLHKQLTEQMLMTKTVTAGLDADTDRLEPTDDEDLEHYAAEANRMADEHAPDDEI